MPESSVEDKQKAVTRLHVALGSSFVPDYSEWRGRENPYYLLFGRKVILPIIL